MADISKCIGLNCKLKYHCFRYTAPDSYWQYYADYKPKNSTTCDNQIEQKCPYCGLRRRHRASCNTNRI